MKEAVSKCCLSNSIELRNNEACLAVAGIMTWRSLNIFRR
jgi:hypothetical protein